MPAEIGSDTNQNTLISRMMNAFPFGDSLTSSYFGTQGTLWGDQSIQSAGAALVQNPVSILPNNTQRPNLYAMLGKRGRTRTRLCGGANCPPPPSEETPVVNLQINRQGDIQLSDRSFNVGDTNLPGFNIPGFNFGGTGDTNFVDIGNQDQGSDAQLASWNPFANDCDKVCVEFQNDAEAYRLCKNDCERSNKSQADNLPWGTEGIKTIALLAIGIVLLAAGLNALTKG